MVRAVVGVVAVLVGIAWLVLGTDACMRSSKTTTTTKLEGACAGTAAGQGCLTLRIAVPDRSRFDGDLRGVLHWAVYKAGDVSMLGPGDSEPVRGGSSDAAVDLAAADAVHVVVVANLPPGSYQTLGYLDDNESGSADKGDPVTFPAKPFDVAGDAHTVHDMPLDYER